MFPFSLQLLGPLLGDPRSEALLLWDIGLRNESNVRFERTPPAAQSASPPSWQARAPQTHALAQRRHSGVTLNSIISRHGA